MASRSSHGEHKENEQFFYPRCGLVLESSPFSDCVDPPSLHSAQWERALLYACYYAMFSSVFLNLEQTVKSFVRPPSQDVYAFHLKQLSLSLSLLFFSGIAPFSLKTLNGVQGRLATCMRCSTALQLGDYEKKNHSPALSDLQLLPHWQGQGEKERKYITKMVSLMGAREIVLFFSIGAAGEQGSIERSHNNARENSPVQQFLSNQKRMVHVFFMFLSSLSSVPEPCKIVERTALQKSKSLPRFPSF